MKTKPRTVHISQGSQLILTDWAADVESIAAGKDPLLWELAVHSLLTDRVLMPDEALAQSRKLARWFGGTARDQLEELFDIGAFGVLVQNPTTYPSEFQDIAAESPIRARAKYIQRYGAKHGEPFALTPAQAQFHAAIDDLLRGSKSRACIRGAKAPIDLHALFQSKLLYAVTDEPSASWIGSGRLDKRTREELGAYIQDPGAAAARIRTKGLRTPQLDPRFEKDPRFTRTLGHYLAATYPEVRDAINALIHSAFAAVLCETEKRAAGRYTSALRELLPPVRRLRSDQGGQTPAVRVVRHVTIPLDLPPLTRGFGKVIAEVRESTAGKQLRTSMRRTGRDARFDEQEKNWRALAAELAARLPRRRVRPVGVTVTELFGAGLEGVVGDLISGPWAPDLLYRGVDGLKAFCLAASIHGVLAIGRFTLGMIPATLEEQRSREQLEGIFQIRCTALPSWGVESSYSRSARYT